MKKNILDIKRKNGTVLVLIIITIGLIGVVMLFLSSASNSMLFQANDSYLKTCEQNLTISGLNWAKVNIRKNSIPASNNTVQLDVNDINILHSSLNVKINNPEDAMYEVQISTACGRARLNLTSTNTYKIKND